MRHMAWVMAGIVVAAVLVASVAASVPTDRPLTNAAQAIARAREYLGLPAKYAGATSATTLVVQADNTPFLHDQVVGKLCWRVTFEGVDVVTPAREGPVKNEAVRGFSVLLDAASGKLFRVSSIGPLSEVAAKRAPEVSEEVIGRAFEEWTGFPEAMPKVSLLEALRNVMEAGGAEQIDAWHVAASYDGNNGHCDRCPTWMIVMRSTRPFEGAQKPEQPGPPPIFGFRVAIDATTGESMFGTPNMY